MIRTKSDELRQAIEEKYTAELSLYRNVRQYLAQLIEHWSHKVAAIEENSLPMIAARAAECMASIELLFTGGRENDASVLMRTMADLTIDVRYMLTDKSLIRRFWDFIPVHNARMADNHHEIYPNKAPLDFERQFFDEKKDCLREDIQTVEDLVRAQKKLYDDAMSRWHYGETWADSEIPLPTGKGKSKRIKVTARRKTQVIDEYDASRNGRPNAHGFEKLLYKIVFRLGSMAVHPNVGSMNKLVTYAPSGMSISAAPEIPHNAFVIIWPTFFAIIILEAIDGHLGLGRAEDIRTLHRQFNMTYKIRPAAAPASAE